MSGHPPRQMVQVEPLAFTSVGLIMAHGAAMCRVIEPESQDNGHDHIVMAMSYDILTEIGKP